jgi:cell wall assembly regulator SMI1
VSDIWERVDEVLAKHEPRLFASLRSPASAAEIERAESSMGLVFPDEIRAAYLRHDGAASPDDMGAFNLSTDSIFVWCTSWSSLQKSVEIWNSEMQLMSALRISEPDLFPEYDSYWDSLTIRRESWNQLRIPLGSGEGSNRTYVDLAPGGIGQKGQIISDDGCMEGVLRAPSLNAYLSVLMDLIEAGEIQNDPGHGWIHRRSRKWVTSVWPTLSVWT